MPTPQNDQIHSYIHYVGLALKGLMRHLFSKKYLRLSAVSYLLYQRCPGTVENTHTKGNSIRDKVPWVTLQQTYPGCFTRWWRSLFVTTSKVVVLYSQAVQGNWKAHVLVSSRWHRFWEIQKRIINHIYDQRLFFWVTFSRSYRTDSVSWCNVNVQNRKLFGKA